MDASAKSTSTKGVRRRRIWGWYFFDWASQPYNTILLTFIFGPYLKELLGDGTRAQAAWGFGIAGAGVTMAILAPILGALADTSGTRMRWIWIFSIMYVAGSAGLWFAAPGNFNLPLTLICFAIGLVGMEFATIFTNALLPDLGSRDEIARISGNGWAFGYLGGLLALITVVCLFAEDPATGATILDRPPLLGLDPEMREGTRAAGPFTALWYVVFMVPFFAFVRDPRPRNAPHGTIRKAISDVVGTVRSLPTRPSLFAFLGASMFYRDALNGMFTFGGIYAAGVLGWSVVETGLMGVIAIVVSTLFAWMGGRAAELFGPKRVIMVSIVVLVVVAFCFIFVSRGAVFGVPVASGSKLPDIIFYVLGATIGAAGGTLLPCSRTMMVEQGDSSKMTEGFGLYALSGKATSFLTPLSIGAVTAATGSQQMGVTPLVLWLVIGFVLLTFVRPAHGDQTETDCGQYAPGS